MLETRVNPPAARVTINYNTIVFEPSRTGRKRYTYTDTKPVTISCQIYRRCFFNIYIYTWYILFFCLFLYGCILCSTAVLNIFVLCFFRERPTRDMPGTFFLEGVLFKGFQRLQRLLDARNTRRILSVQKSIIIYLLRNFSWFRRNEQQYTTPAINSDSKANCFGTTKIYIFLKFRRSFLRVGANKNKERKWSRKFVLGPILCEIENADRKRKTAFFDLKFSI